MLYNICHRSNDIRCGKLEMVDFCDVLIAVGVALDIWIRYTGNTLTCEALAESSVCYGESDSGAIPKAWQERDRPNIYVLHKTAIMINMIQQSKVDR